MLYIYMNIWDLNWEDKRQMILTDPRVGTCPNKSKGHDDGRTELEDDTFKFYYCLAEMVRYDLLEEKGVEMGEDAADWLAWIRSDQKFYFS